MYFLEILATQPEGFEWIIEGAGKARYRFRLSRINRIEPRTDLAEIKLPDSTPEIISAFEHDPRCLYMTDAVHPTKAGLRDWIVPYMQEKLLNIAAGGR